MTPRTPIKIPQTFYEVLTNRIACSPYRFILLPGQLVEKFLSLTLWGALLTVAVLWVTEQSAHHIIIFSWSTLFNLIVPVTACLLTALLPLIAKPMYSLICLLGIFSNVVVYYLTYGAHYLGFSLMVIYVGAVAVIFLFVIMLLDAKGAIKTEGFWTRMAQRLTVVTFGFLLERLWTCVYKPVERAIASRVASARVLEPTSAEATEYFIRYRFNDISQISELYTVHGIPFLVTTGIIFTALLGAIILATQITERPVLAQTAVKKNIGVFCVIVLLAFLWEDSLFLSFDNSDFFWDQYLAPWWVPTRAPRFNRVPDGRVYGYAYAKLPSAKRTGTLASTRKLRLVSKKATSTLRGTAVYALFVKKPWQKMQTTQQIALWRLWRPQRVRYIITRVLMRKRSARILARKTTWKQLTGVKHVASPFSIRQVGFQRYIRYVWHAKIAPKVFYYAQYINSFCLLFVIFLFVNPMVTLLGRILFYDYHLIQSCVLTVPATLVVAFSDLSATYAATSPFIQWPVAFVFFVPGVILLNTMYNSSIWTVLLAVLFAADILNLATSSLPQGSENTDDLFAYRQDIGYRAVPKPLTEEERAALLVHPDKGRVDISLFFITTASVAAVLPRQTVVSDLFYIGDCIDTIDYAITLRDDILNFLAVLFLFANIYLLSGLVVGLFYLGKRPLADQDDDWVEELSLSLVTTLLLISIFILIQAYFQYAPDLSFLTVSPTWRADLYNFIDDRTGTVPGEVVIGLVSVVLAYFTLRSLLRRYYLSKSLPSIPFTRRVLLNSMSFDDYWDTLPAKTPLPSYFNVRKFSRVDIRKARPRSGKNKKTKILSKWLNRKTDNLRIKK